MGRWDCSEDKCSSTCALYGMSHVKTFDGKVYDFEAAPCGYNLVVVRWMCVFKLTVFIHCFSIIDVYKIIHQAFLMSKINYSDFQLLLQCSIVS